MLAILGALCLLQTITLAPAQLITLRDGKVGVNFAGYHADAGLGGLLTGNSAHGGLSASAGTPWGARAAAGLGGDLDGRAAGVGYAAAQANPQVGASALLGGSAGEHGYIGAEAHSPGKVAISATQHNKQPITSAPLGQAPLPTVASHVQKVKPPKKYSLIKQDSNRRVDNKNHVESATELSRPTPSLSAASASALPSSPIHQTSVPAGSLIIVKRPRLHAKRERHRQRTIYVMQQPQEEYVEEVHQLDEVPLKSEAKVVHPLRYTKTVERPQSVDRHVVASQGNPVGLALDIPIGILRSLQQSIGGLIGGNAPPAQGVPANSG
ncbi:uncharacterized protein [Drosophila tropicalis]|uniref:uncharacterized protein isoform X1 n=1 Tax=Drosophila tropicalis TaxID=46794 RepID=UPI0035AB8A14